MIFTEQVDSQAEVNEISEDPVEPSLKLRPEEASFNKWTKALKNEKKDVLLNKTETS